MIFRLLLISILAAANFPIPHKKVDSFLEKNLYEEAVVSTTQITIPNYPRAYNPSLIPYKDGYLLSFRYTARFPEGVRKYRTDASFIGVVKLDKKLKVIKESVQLLNIQSYSSKFSLSAEDGRLLLWNDKIYLFFNDSPLLNPKGFAMYFAELIEEAGVFELNGSAKLLNYPFVNQVEKNWSPFVYENKLCLIYSDNPRTILEVNLETGNCHEVSRSSLSTSWDFGEIRGGTPAYRLGDHYLTFFHSCFRSSKKRVYVMGAYLFDPEPPFKVKSITLQPLADLSNYTEDNKSKILFPCGIVIQKNSILVSSGKSDNQIQITIFDKEKLLNSMASINYP